MSGDSDLLCDGMSPPKIPVLKVFSAFDNVSFPESLYIHIISLLPSLAHVKACLIKLLTCTVGECCVKSGNFYAILHTLMTLMLEDVCEASTTAKCRKETRL